MIRIRSKKLLSGVSTLAVMAAFGAATVPAQAAPLVVPAGPNAPVVVTGTTTSSVTIQPGAIVDADGSGNSFTNSGSIFGLTTALWVNNALLSGGVSNTGDMLGSSYGIRIQNNSVVGGNIANGTGTIGGSDVGILIDTSVISGSLTNALGGVISGSTGGVILNNTVMNGSISNAGDILGDVGVRLSGNSVLVGGVVNDGTIVGSGALQAGGIELLGAATVASGGIVNNGFIGGFSGPVANGILINTTGALVGNIDNSGTIAAGTASQAVAINLTAGVIAGSIINSGQILASNATGATAIRLSGGTLAGNIDNTGLISGLDRGIAITGATVAGQILNQTGGVISATTTSGTAIVINGGNLTGGIYNQGDILANATSGAGIVISGGSVQNGLTNSGLISATGTGGTAIGIIGGTFSGGIENTGDILGDSAGIVISGATFTGGITNSGEVSAANGYGIGIFGTDPTGDIVNEADGLINGGSGAGITWTGTNFTGSVLNDGAITAFNQGIIMNGTGTIAGDVTNNGDITASSAIVLNAPLIDGSVTNTGLLSATFNGITMNGTITGDVTNDGNIVVGGTGIFLNGLVQGALSNSSDITAATGLNITGQVAGGITNSGNISGTNLGINLSGATAAHTITQTAGSIAAPTALFMVNGQDDTFVGQGGSVEGNILADGFDSFTQDGTGTFAYVAGTATGIYHFDINGTGTFVLGSAARGVDGVGVNVTANHMYFNSGAGSAYLDDNTVVTLGDNFFADSASVTEFFITTNTAQHGQINATNAITLAGTLAAYLDPLTFAATPLATGVTLTYTDVMTGGSRVGTFDNVGSILVTSSPFFTGNIVYDGTTVDIELQRLAFGDVLIAESHNQQAVGNALETIYSAGGYSTDLEDAFAALFGAATTAEVQAMLIELSGSQHAQVGQAVHNLTNSINGMVRERLDGVVLSQDGVRWAGTPGQRYAQAAAVASDAASASGLRGSQGMTRGASGWSAWGRAFENEINVDSDADASGYDHDSQGGIVGVDYATSPNTTVGASVAYATSDMWFDATPDTADIESWQVNLFGSHGYGRFYVDGQATYAQHDIGTLRSIDLPAPAGSALATASYEASSWSVNGELGAIWRLGRVNMQPSVAVAYVDTSADGFTETSTAGYALNVSGADGESLSTTLALRASGQWMMAKTPVVPDFKIGWRHEYMDDVSSFGASFVDDPTVAMSIVSSKIQADSLVISSGATFGVTKNFEIFFDVNGQYNADASATNASGGLRVTW